MGVVVGRNDPCPCGSGRKYKKCCLPKERAAGRVRAGSQEAEASLRDKIAEFHGEGRFDPEREEALEVWTTLCGGEVPDSIEAIQLMDWFIHDYRLRRYGITLLELFDREKGGELEESERRILEGWLASHLGVYEVTRVEEGSGLGLRDVFTGEELFVHDVSASRGAVIWDLLHVRVIPEGEGFGLGDAALRLSRADKEELLGLGRDWFRAYRRSRPKASWAQFMKDNGFLFNSAAAIIEAQRGERQIATGEGHEVVISKATYRIRNPAGALKGLGGIDGFYGEAEEARGKASYEWMVPARSVYAPSPQGPRGVITAFCVNADGPRMVCMGSIRVSRGKLTLECLSRERLAEGRGILEQHLGDSIEHLSDKFTGVQELLAPNSRSRRTSRRERPSRLSDDERRVLSEFLDEHYRDWVDTPLPALDGLTPRQAQGTKRGRAKLEEVLRLIENDEEHNRKRRGWGYPVERIRELLRSGPPARESIDPRLFCPSEDDRTKLNWFFYEFALNIYDEFRDRFAKRFSSLGIDDEAVAAISVFVAQRLREAYLSHPPLGQGTGMEESPEAVEFTEEAPDVDVAGESHEAMAAALKRLLAHCRTCGGRCLEHADERCTLFDEVLSSRAGS